MPNWKYNNRELKTIPEGAWGFVYEILNKDTKRKYIGRRKFYDKVIRPPLKGKKRRRHDKVESKWREYNGSSKELLKDIAKGHRITKTILCICMSKSECNYIEAREILYTDALLRESYYNESLRVPQLHSNQLERIWK